MSELKYESIYKLELKDEVSVLVDVRSIRPDKFAGKTLNEIKDIRVFEGSFKRRLEDLFDIEGPSKACDNASLIKVVISGGRSLSKLMYLGFKMHGGCIEVLGDVGPLAGYKMVDGRLIIHGSARAWLGAKMRGGLIEVYKSASDFIGSKLQGEKPGKGMRGGMIVVHGNAGSNIGVGMKGGVIIIEGSAGNLVGYEMAGGSILVMNGCESFYGARMTGGKIVLNGRVGSIIPSLYIDDIVSKAKVRDYILEKEFALFIGDVLVNGVGRVYISYDDNIDLLTRYIELLPGVE